MKEKIIWAIVWNVMFLPHRIELMKARIWMSIGQYASRQVDKILDQYD